MERNLRLWVIAAGVLSLALWTGGSAFAADGDAAAAEATPADPAALDPAALHDALLSDPAFQGLPPEEQDALLRQATEDVAGGLSTAREATGGERLGGRTEERAGIIIMGPGSLGAPDLGGGLRPELTAEENALMEKVGARHDELTQQGLDPEAIDKQLKQDFSEEFSEFEQKYGGKEGHEGYGHGGREILGQEGGTYGEGRSYEQLKELYQEGRPVGEAIEHHPGGSESYGREVIQHEMMERPTYEAPTFDHSYEAPTVEHFGSEPTERSYEMPTVERSYEAPTVERSYETPTVEVERSYEAPTVEHSYEAPTAERPTYEAPEHTGDGGGMPHY